MAQLPNPLAPSPATDPWLCFAPRETPRLRLFCFAYAGGSPAVFRSWHERLGDDVEVRAAELAGRGRRIRDAPPTTIAAGADELYAGLEPLLDVPFAFYGHSMGALLAYEIARRLAADGRDAPVRFFPSGSAAPDVEPWLKGAAELTEFGLIDAVRPLGGVPEAVVADPDLRAIVLRALRADLVAWERYVEEPAPALTCSITAFAGERDPKVKVEDVEGWRSRTAAGFELETFDGAHLFLESHLPDIARIVRDRCGV